MRGGVEQIKRLRKSNMFQNIKAAKMGSIRIMYFIRSGVPSAAQKEPRQPEQKTSFSLYQAYPMPSPVGEMTVGAEAMAGGGHRQTPRNVEGTALWRQPESPGRAGFRSQISWFVVICKPIYICHHCGLTRTT